MNYYTRCLQHIESKLAYEMRVAEAMRSRPTPKADFKANRHVVIAQEKYENGKSYYEQQHFFHQKRAMNLFNEFSIATSAKGQCFTDFPDIKKIVDELCADRNLEISLETMS